MLSMSVMPPISFYPNKTGDNIASRSFLPLLCLIHNSIRLLSISETFNATTSLIRNPAPKATDKAVQHFRLLVAFFRIVSKVYQMLILAIAPVNQSDNLVVKTDFIEVNSCGGYWHLCHLIWLLPLSIFLTCLTFISKGKKFLLLLIIFL
jgi:hypothetical protein